MRFDFQILIPGNWTRGEPQECVRTCGVGEGKSGTPGTVTCDSSSCDPDTKPAAKICPETADCGKAWMPMHRVITHRVIIFLLIFLLASSLTAELSNPVVLCLCVSISNPNPRQLGARRATRMRPHMRSRRGHVGHPGQRHLRQLELRP